MHESGLARELWPQLQQIAETRGIERVTRVEMIVGMLHGVSEEMLVHSFEHAFEGTNFQGARLEISVVEPGESFRPPGNSQRQTATGWELLVVRLEGE